MQVGYKREREGSENDSYVFVLSKGKNRVALYRELAGGVKAGDRKTGQGQDSRSLLVDTSHLRHHLAIQVEVTSWQLDL